MRSVVSLVIGVLGVSSLGFGNPDTASAARSFHSGWDFFETRIRPVLAKNCYGCHGPDQQQSSLRVDSREALLNGGQERAVHRSGGPRQESGGKAVRHDGLKMPIGSRLKDAEIAAIEEWVRKDAPWPAVLVTKGSSRRERYAQLAREHWAFQQVRKPTAPAVSDPSWSKTALDRFIFSRLHQSGLSPARPADKRILMRRLSYVLTGLPPKAEEMDRFAEDSVP